MTAKQIKEIYHDTMMLKDGTHLAYRAWLPVDAERSPVPSILEYLPYRKSDGTVVRDAITMPATARHGYAYVRFDMRGSGESEGFFEDEYSEQELVDGEEIIEWLCAQKWCDGNVGMVGISWGGFNGLQMAYRQVPGLKGVITLCSSVDRFNQDIHFANGCLLNDNLDWAGFFWAYSQARMPDPELIGENWQNIWVERLEKLPFLPRQWLALQTKSAYWKHGSVNEDYSRIKVPVYAIGGWADAYRNTIFHLVENLQVPCKGLIGPWGHRYPHMAMPGPKIDYVKESVRWWDFCLKNTNHEIVKEPALQYYLLDSVRPQADHEYKEGCWQAESSWPSVEISNQTYYLDGGKLLTQTTPTQEKQSICSPEDTGLAAGKFMVGIGVSGEHPLDQRIDDEGSLVFDTDILDDALAIVGIPKVNVAVSSNRLVANLAVRLGDVSPNGEVTLITYGVLNLTHRHSNELPEPLVLGDEYIVELELNSIAYRLAQGHRLRLSLSTAYWPLIWPSPEKVTLNFNLGLCRLSLPCKPDISINSNPALLPYEDGEEGNFEIRRQENLIKNVEKNKKTGWTKVTVDIDYGCIYHPDCDTEIDFQVQQIYQIQADDPSSALYNCKHHVKMIKRGVLTTLESQYEMKSTKLNFYIKAEWSAYLDEKCVFEKNFDELIPRQLI